MILSGETDKPCFARYLLLINWRSCRSPSELLYCSTPAPYFENTFSVARCISCTGKNEGFGRPPAKEMTAGSREAFKISLINERGTPFIGSAKIFSISNYPLYGLSIFHV
jgi:hypothetical protein